MKDIIRGHYNELTGKEEDLYLERIEICKQCPLYKLDVFAGPICNNKKWMSLDDLHSVSDIPRPGYKKGCGCRLNAKTRLGHRHCPFNKW